jgi:hypothetical protein
MFPRQNDVANNTHACLPEIVVPRRATDQMVLNERRGPTLKQQCANVHSHLVPLVLKGLFIFAQVEKILLMNRQQWWICGPTSTVWFLVPISSRALQDSL